VILKGVEFNYGKRGVFHYWESLNFGEGVSIKFMGHLEVVVKHVLKHIKRILKIILLHVHT